MMPGQKPIGPVKVDYSGIGNGLTLAIFTQLFGPYPFYSKRRTITGQIFESFGNGLLVDKNGWYVSGGGANFFCDGAIPASGTNPFTVFVIADLDSVSADIGLFGTRYGSAVGFQLEITNASWGNTNRALLFCSNGTGYITSRKASQAVTTGLGTYAGRFVGGSITTNSNYATFQNGVRNDKVNGTYGTASSVDGTRVMFGNGQVGTNPWLFGRIVFAATWNRALSDAEIFSMHMDPYQVLIPA